MEYEGIELNYREGRIFKCGIALGFILCAIPMCIIIILLGTL